MLIVSTITVGLIVGLMTSFLGLGGGILIIPALSIYFRLPYHEAIATSLFTIFMVTTANVIRFQIKGMIIWQVVLLVAVFASIVSYIAGLSATMMPREYLMIIFILFLLFMSVRTYFLKNNRIKNSENTRRARILSAIKIGSLAGAISGLTGVAGGSVITPLLMNSGRIDMNKVVPTSNSIMLFTTFFASFAFLTANYPTTRAWQIGYIHLDIAFFLFLSSFPTALWGTQYQDRLSLKWRKNIVTLFLLIIAIRMIFHLF